MNVAQTGLDETRQTRHARERQTARAIPEGVIKMILEHGESLHAREGAQKWALTPSSMKCIKKHYGPGIADAVAPFRRAYVVLAGDTVVTVAFASKPLFR